MVNLKKETLCPSQHFFFHFCIQSWLRFNFPTPLRYYRKRGSASYIVREVRSVRERDTERERERKRDRRKWRHHCRAKIGDEFKRSHAKNSHNCCEFTLSLAKKSHFSFLPSQFLSHHCGAEIHTFRFQQIRPLSSPCSDSLLNGASRATSDWKPKTNDQILPSPIIGGAEALPILCVRYARWEREIQREREREREREIDGSDVIIVALKLAMSLHFPMPKIRTIAVSSHFPLPKNRTFRFSVHTSCLTIVALKFAVHTFRCQKIRPLCSRADNLVLVKFGFSALSVPRFFGV